MTPGILLASNSPRRRQILGLTGWNFKVCPANIDEQVLPGEAPSDYVMRLALQKAQAAGSLAQPGELVLAADTTVADGNSILGKPADAAEARQMLAALRARDHMVFTGIAVFDPSRQRLQGDLGATRVWMRDYNDQEMEDYILSGDPFDKAGGYAIQNDSFHPVDRIEGCYACVVGLPLCRVVNLMRDFGQLPSRHPGARQDVTWDCQNGLNSACAVYRSLEREESGQGKEK